MERVELLVLLILVCATKCLAMSHDELEEFANFLKKTSRLSPTLKKGVDPDDEYDEDELISDQAWEDSGKFEGDLVLNERQRRLIVEEVAEGLSRNGIRDGTKRWPNNEVIYYIQKEHFSGDQLQAIQNGIDDLARASCVTFRPYRKGDRDAVVIQGSRRGCFSQVGYQGGYQVLNLSGRHPVGRGCFRHGTVVHEMLHTLGFYHMQSSPDRDDYVNVIWANIIESARHNFRKYNLFAVSDFGVGYDYDSVLHYSRRAFSVNGQDTIVPKKSGADIGQRVGLSDKDAQKLNKMYCDVNSDEGDIQKAEEDATDITEHKKKIKKNKPFDGHGIGYHQGKAVVIKLLPAAETYKLPDVPSFHVFDYFSKAPQTLPTPENQGFRVGKEIAYSFTPPEHSTMNEHAMTTYYEIPELKSNEGRESELKKYTDHRSDSIVKYSSAEHDKMRNKKKKNKADTLDSEKSLDLPDNMNHGSIDAFNRLSKIIKLHVYPSQTPDLSIYKANEEYLKYLDPTKIIEADNESSVIPNDNTNVKTNEKTAVHFIKNFNKLDTNESVFGDDGNIGNVNENKLKLRNNYHGPVHSEEANVDDTNLAYRTFLHSEPYNGGYTSAFDYAAPENNQDFYRKLYSPNAINIPNENSFHKQSDKRKLYFGEILQLNPYDHDSFEKSNDSEKDKWRDYSDFPKASSQYHLFRK